MALEPDELEQAEELDKAVDSLLRGEDPIVTDPELQPLIEVARLRHRLALQWQQEAQLYRDKVWELVWQKLGQKAPKDNCAP